MQKLSQRVCSNILNACFKISKQKDPGSRNVCLQLSFLLIKLIILLFRAGYFCAAMKKVLIIEDDEAIRENTAELLEINNFEVRTAANGNTGFDIARIFLPDVILCDMMMPQTDGSAFLKLVKSDTRVQEIPLVFFSAGTVPVGVQKNLIKASNGFLKKPFLKEDLITTIEGVLARA